MAENFPSTENPLIISPWLADMIRADDSGDPRIAWAKRGLEEGFIVEAVALDAPR